MIVKISTYYKIDIDYIKYLYNFDNRIQYNSNREDTYTAKRPYLGVVLKYAEVFRKF